MKEILHFTFPGSILCDTMSPVIDKIVSNYPDIHYIRVDTSEGSPIFEYYKKKYPGLSAPSFLGIVDGKVHDGHIGPATEMILLSLVD
jgi:hypothetical protein